MNILVIPEDFRNDQYILKPLFSRLFRTFGRPSVHVRVCQNPLLGGVTEALKSERLTEIVERYQGEIDIFVLCIERDGKRSRRQALNRIESEFKDEERAFFAENACLQFAENAPKTSTAWPNGSKLSSTPEGESTMANGGQNTIPVEKVVRRDPEVHSGALVFSGTRVPVDNLVGYLKGGHSIEEFLQDYPTVERWQLESYLDLSSRGLDYLRAQDARAS